MPIEFRTLAPTLTAAGYRFPLEKDYIVEEDWPWYGHSANVDILCENCSHLDFRWLFTQALSGYTVTDGTHSATLSDGLCMGLHKTISRRLHCEFCQLIIHALEYGADIEMLNQYNDWSQQEVWINNHFYDAQGSVVMVSGSDETERVARLGIRLKSGPEDNLVFVHGGRHVMIQQIFESKDSLAPASGRVMNKSSAELVQSIKTWMEPCVVQEDAAHIAQDSPITRIRLIDTQDQCIVGPVSNKRYVALSYTWGKIDPLVLLGRNQVELYTKGALVTYREHLPVTIQDAISLCAQLRERYLWVDSLCIVQDTPDKHSQIQQMDRIYYGAAWCIVAAAGRDANAGLAGVSIPRNLPQRIVRLDGISLANLIPTLTQSVVQTFWQKRAWCFQEDLLSLRKIIFTADQTYYKCPHGERSEDTHGLAHGPAEMAALELPWLSQMEDLTNWGIYCGIVDDYSDRRLSFEADVLNAFAGISAYLSSSLFTGCPFNMGIPMCSLEAGLLWTPNGKLRRRAGFPSWSWAGWTGCGELSSDQLANVSYPHSQMHEKGFERIIRHVQWHILDQEDLVTCIPSPSWEGWKDWTRVVDGDLDNVYYIHNESGPRQKFAHPISQVQWSSASLSSLLSCTAEVARLTVTSKHTDLWIDEGVCDDGHEVCHLKVFDLSKRYAGTIIMDGMTFETTFERGSISQKELHFVKISQTTLTSQDDPAWNPATRSFTGKPGHPAINPDPAPPPLEEEFDYRAFDHTICWCMYSVMVVSFEEDVATRLAVGRVYYTAFDDASPEKKTFSLG